ncbi:6-phosphogluconolactonase [Elizabethkingia anophelis]|uniref:6-phosphogluconolactonase n=1 Tax=Elizabethkingia anophelis TaxID=1117645 RepID=UPI000B34B687|nr:6-phosphogluconolactonase [Elizabethkingia anophelis]AVF48526.1 6-phosphogluconolactonase [Elizabethkingia anophelis]AVF52520.1 6-phosphogluconolactonase [Elizabethkingia anophelis]MBG0506168.1 6-phosphogluconolactonase [Elizabethkingia anophelis]MCT4072712.1 6-phosphogluconolactonase [Elizabethkingia anophelis]MDV3900919.1 6-phosphogluconolactonase [Elizabethkingia anophelis]
MNITVFNDLEKLYKKAADTFIDLSKKSIEKHNRFVVALSGGSSPKAIFSLLATPEYAEQIEWNKVYFFWVDERWVPLDNEKSNARMTFETLLDKVPVNRDQIFPMYQNGTEPEEFAKVYEQQIKNVLGDDGIFDFILLGMGDDGHTASLFPGEAILNETQKWVDAYYLKPQEMFRITLTAPLINKAANILAVAFGESKKHALNEVLNGEYNPVLYPMQLINKKESFQFFTDEKAKG